jgi:ribosomal protein S18 acetylase RimI-like enzyme
MPYDLRPAIAGDLPAIAAVFIETRTRCLPFIVWDYSQTVMEEVFGRQMAEMEFWVAEADDRIVGFIAFTPNEVDHLYILPEFHHQGIGSALLKVALTGEEVRLWVFQENRSARRFYERHGFKMEFETDGRDNMEKTPDARYVLRGAKK